MLWHRHIAVDHGPELAELRSRIATIEAENERLEDVAERRRLAVEQMAGERDRALAELNECRKEAGHLDAVLASEREGSAAREASLAFVAEAANNELAKYRKSRGT